VNRAAAVPTVYLDHAASTPVRPAAFEAMVPWLSDACGNPSGSHRVAREARRAVDDARDSVAVALGARPEEIVFCAGGTESDNLAVFGTMARRAGVAVCSAVEHHAVLEPVEQIGGRVVGVDASGALDLDELDSVLVSTSDVAFVSVMLANNETGVIQSLEAVAEVVRRRAPDAVLHTDAVQAFCWLDVAAAAEVADLISITGHKFGGPKGAGVLVVRRGVRVSPRVVGGGQEWGLRSGTHNVPAIVGLGVAVEEAVATRADTVARVGALRDRLANGLRSRIDGVIETGVTTRPDGTVDRSRKVAGSCHLCVEGIESEALLFLVEGDGVCASAASSCTSGAQDPSHVLAAMGYDRATAAGSLRLSLGWCSTDADVDRALAVIPDAVTRLRRPIEV
jgi:cysteine desulfurase